MNESYVAYAQANLLAPTHSIYGGFLSLAVMKRHDARMMGYLAGEEQIKQQRLLANIQKKQNEMANASEANRQRMLQLHHTGYRSPYPDEQSTSIWDNPAYPTHSPIYQPPAAPGF